MVRIRQGWLVAMLGLGLFAACKKDDKPTAGTADKPAESSSGATSDDLAFLPADSEVVLGVNIAQVQQNSLWKGLVEPKLMAGQTQRLIADFRAKCGFDPMTSVKSLSLGARDMTGGKPNAVLVLHGLDKAKALDCVDKLKDELTSGGGEVTRDGDLVLAKDRRGMQAAVSFLDGGTAIVVVGDNGTTSGVKAVAAGGSKLRTTAGFAERYKKVNTRDSLWMVVDHALLDKLPLMMKPQASFGSVNMTDGVALDMRIQFENPGDATAAADLGKSQTQTQAVQEYIDKAEFIADGAELHATIKSSSQKLPKLQALITQLVNLASAFAGGMGGLGTP